MRPHGEGDLETERAIEPSTRSNEVVLEGLEPELAVVDLTYDVPSWGVFYDARTPHPEQKNRHLEDMAYVDELLDSIQAKGLDAKGFIDEDLRTACKQTILLIQRRHDQFQTPPYSREEIRILVSEMQYVDYLHRVHRKTQRDDGTLYSREHLFKAVRNAIVSQGITDLVYLVAVLHHDDGEDLDFNEETEAGTGEVRKRIQPNHLLGESSFRTELEALLGPTFVGHFIQVFREKVLHIDRGLTKEKNKRKSSEANEADNFRTLLEYTDRDVLVVLARLVDRLHNLRTLEGKAKRKPETARETAMTSATVHARFPKTFQMDRLYDEIVEACFEHVNPELVRDIKLRQLRRIDKRLNGESPLGLRLFSIVDAAQREELGIKFIGIRPRSFGSLVNPEEIRNPAYDPFSEMDDWDPLFEVLVHVDDPKNIKRLIQEIASIFREDMEIGAGQIDVMQTPSTTRPQKGTCISIYDPHLGGQVFIRINDERSEALSLRGVFEAPKQEPVRGLLPLPEYRLPSHHGAAVRRVLHRTGPGTDVTDIFNLAQKELLHPTVMVRTPDLDQLHLPSGSLVVDFAAVIHENVLATFSGATVRSESPLAPPKKGVQALTPLEEGDIVDIHNDGHSLLDLKWGYLGNSHTRAAMREILRKDGPEVSRERGKAFLVELGTLLGLEDPSTLASRLVAMQKPSVSPAEAPGREDWYLRKVGFLREDPFEALAQNTTFAQAPLAVCVEAPDVPDILSKLSHEFGRAGISIVGDGLIFGERYQKVEGGPVLTTVRIHIQSPNLKQVTAHDILLCLLHLNETYPTRIETDIFKKAL